MRLTRGSLILAVLIAAQLGCAPTEQTPSLPLEVGYAGCELVQRGPVCYVKNDQALLRLWARSSPSAQLEVKGSVEILETHEVQAGTLFHLRPKATSGSLRLVATEGPGRSADWQLSWQPAALPPQALIQADKLLIEGRFDEAREILERAWPTLQDEDLGGAYRIRGRLDRAFGNSDAASAALHQAVKTFQRQGWHRRAASCAAELAYGLIYDRHQLGEARALLDGFASDRDFPAEALYNLSYLRGLLALNTGDVRGSLNLLRNSAEIAARVGLQDWRTAAEQPLAHQLQRVGQGTEAATILSRQRLELPTHLSACNRAFLLNNLGWNQLLMRENQGVDNVPEDPTPWLEEARELFEDKPCPESDERANVAVNLALAALQQNRSQAAGQHLERAAEHEPRPDLRSQFWRLEIAARIAMLELRPTDALSLYEQLEALANEALSVQTLWKAAAGRAAALEALDRPLEALDAYAEAESHLDRASLAVPIDAGRESFVDMGSRVTKHHLDLLVRLGRFDKAFELARRARSRVVRSLHRQSRLSQLSNEEQARWDAAISAYRSQRRAFDAAAADDWRLPADQLRRQRHSRRLERDRLQHALDSAFATLDGLSPTFDQTLPAVKIGETRLLYFPGEQGWLGFAEDSEGIIVHSLGDIPRDSSPATLSQTLLHPFAEAIDRASRVCILPFSWLREVDFHALPYDGDLALLEKRPVLYCLDLPQQPTDQLTARQALVVADPSGDLDAARAEGQLVAQELSRQQTTWNTRQLTGQDAKSATLRSLLPAVDLFHYAGHGVFAGRDGWQSALPLADDSLLTVADILALERAPRQVVLSGCETARSAAGAQVESATGLAHAFLTAGSRSVVAATRPVEDQMAAELVRYYYRSWLAGNSPSEALRQAQLALREQHPGSDWKSFRILVP